MDTNNTPLARFFSSHADGIAINLLFLFWGAGTVATHLSGATLVLSAVTLVILTGGSVLLGRLPLWASLLAAVALFAAVSAWDSVYDTNTMDSWLVSLGVLLAVGSLVDLVLIATCIRNHRRDTRDQAGEA